MKERKAEKQSVILFSKDKCRVRNVHVGITWFQLASSGAGFLSRFPSGPLLAPGWQKSSRGKVHRPAFRHLRSDAQKSGNRTKAKKARGKKALGLLAPPCPKPLLKLRDKLGQAVTVATGAISPAAAPFWQSRSHATSKRVFATQPPSFPPSRALPAQGSRSEKPALFGVPTWPRAQRESPSRGSGWLLRAAASHLLGAGFQLRAPPQSDGGGGKGRESIQKFSSSERCSTHASDSRRSCPKAVINSN